MKQWFPFTDYDFYAYIAAGVILIAAIDYAFFGSVLISKNEWPLVHVVFWIAVAYIIGQIVANPSTLLLEQWLGRTVLSSPLSVMLGLAPLRLRERAIQEILVGRIYGPLNGPMSRRILAYCALQIAGKSMSAEAVFNIAYPVARRIPDCAARLDQFRNLYGFCRNTSFVAAVSCMLFLLRATLSPTSVPKDYWLSLAALIVAIGMFGRFVKFYSEFSAEMLRTFYSEITKVEQ